MRMRKWVALAATASIAFWTPSLVPVKAASLRLRRSPRIVPDGRHGLRAAASSSRATVHGPSPWPVVVVIVGVVSVMTNAAWIWRTQCRELSSQEAMTSTFLPFIGMAFDAQASKCR